MAHQLYTLTNMQTMLADKYESGAFWTSTESKNAINEALLMWNLLVGQWVTTVTDTTVANQLEYSLSSSLSFSTRISIAGRPLQMSYMADMDNGRPGWRSHTTADGTPIPTEVKKWIPMGLKGYMLWPRHTAGGATLTIEGVANTPRLVNAGDYIDIGAESLNAILGYAIHVMALKEGGSRFAATIPLFEAFLQYAAEENGQLKTLFKEALRTDEMRLFDPHKKQQTDYDSIAGRKV